MFCTVSFPVEKHFYPCSNAEYVIIKLKRFFIFFNVPPKFGHSKSRQYLIYVPFIHHNTRRDLFHANESSAIIIYKSK